jgi:16S rRNA (guanine966-N2)-methyltransferase
LRRKKLTIVEAIAQNGAHVSTAPSAGPMSHHRDKERPGAVRIIGGRWRGTRLAVADAPGLRPTTDRVRETLFNWLQPKLPGARVLDLFAGSGALGLEALSRGAREAVLVERDPRLAESLRDVVARLQADGQAQVVHADALAWLGAPLHGRFDLVFLDPPFAAGLWPEVLERLPPWLSGEAWLYVETPLAAAVPLGPGWSPHREGSTREVRYALYRQARRAGAPTATLAPDPNADGAATE